jgi:hypothetical protein
MSDDSAIQNDKMGYEFQLSGYYQTNLERFKGFWSLILANEKPKASSNFRSFACECVFDVMDDMCGDNLEKQVTLLKLAIELGGEDYLLYDSFYKPQSPYPRFLNEVASNIDVALVVAVCWPLTFTEKTLNQLFEKFFHSQTQTLFDICWFLAKRSKCGVFILNCFRYINLRDVTFTPHIGDYARVLRALCMVDGLVNDHVLTRMCTSVIDHVMTMVDIEQSAKFSYRILKLVATRMRMHVKLEEDAEDLMIAYDQREVDRNYQKMLSIIEKFIWTTHFWRVFPRGFDDFDPWVGYRSNSNQVWRIRHHLRETINWRYHDIRVMSKSEFGIGPDRSRISFMLTCLGMRNRRNSRSLLVNYLTVDLFRKLNSFLVVIC